MNKWINLLTVIFAITIYFNDGSFTVIENNSAFNYHRNGANSNTQLFVSYTEGNAVHNIPVYTIKEIVETPNMAVYGGN